MAKEPKIRVRVYFNVRSLQAIAEDAEKVGLRRGGLQLATAKEHGFAGEKEWNTDGISKFLKFTWKYWKETEAHRLEETAEALRIKKEQEDKLRRLGHTQP